MDIQENIHRIKEVMGYQVGKILSEQSQGSQHPMQKYVDNNCINGGTVVQIVINGKEVPAVKKQSVKVPNRQLYYLHDFTFGYFDENDNTKFIFIPNKWVCKTPEDTTDKNVVQNIGKVDYKRGLRDTEFQGNLRPYQTFFETDNGIKLVTRGMTPVITSSSTPEGAEFFLEKDNVVIPIVTSVLQSDGIRGEEFYQQTPEFLNSYLKKAYQKVTTTDTDYVLTRYMTSDEFYNNASQHQAIPTTPRIIYDQLLKNNGLEKEYSKWEKSLGKTKLSEKAKQLEELANKIYDEKLIEYVKKHNGNDMFLGKTERKRYRELTK